MTETYKIVRGKNDNEITPTLAMSDTQRGNDLRLQKSGFWATVCKTVRPVLSDRCLSCLSVTLVYCVQTDGSI